MRFGVIGRARIHRRVQVVHFHQNPVRRACVRMAVAGVIVWQSTGKTPVKGFTQAREPKAALARIQARAVRIRAAHAQMVPLHAGGTAKAAGVVLQAEKACFSQDWPICSKRSSLFAPPLMR